MLSSAKIKTRCPVCHASYRVPPGSIGQKARCGKCNSSFRVAEVKKKTPAPTEGDILDWLNEGVDEEYLAKRPRVIMGGQPRNPLDQNQTAKPTPSVPPDSRTATTSLSAQRAVPDDPRSTVRDNEQVLRRTG